MKQFQTDFTLNRKQRILFFLRHLCPEHEVIAGIIIHVAQKKKFTEYSKKGVEPMTSW